MPLFSIVPGEIFFIVQKRLRIGNFSWFKLKALELVHLVHFSSFSSFSSMKHCNTNQETMYSLTKTYSSNNFTTTQKR